MAEYQLPSDRRPPSGYWQSAGLVDTSSYEIALAGTGPQLNVVTGYGADPTGVSDSSSAIQTAMNVAAAAGNNTMVYFPAGTYRMNNPISTPGFGGLYFYANWCMSGELDAAGNNLAILDFHLSSATPAFTVGAGFSQPGRPSSTIVSGLTKGSNQIVLSSNPGFSSYGQGVIHITTDPNKTWSVYDTGSTLVEYFAIRATALASNTPSSGLTTITLDSPIVEDYSATQVAGAYFVQYEFSFLYNFGLQNITIDGTNSGSNMVVGVAIDGCTNNCWYRNVKVLGQQNYAFRVYEAVHCLFEENWILAGVGGGSNHGGMLLNTCTQSLFRHNIVYNNGPDWEVNQGTQGCVFAFNYSPDTIQNNLNTNHGPQNNSNLYEGNQGNGVISDGYFGGATKQTYFRCWLTGRNDTGGVHSAFVLKRMDRQSSVVGCLLASPSWTYPGVPWNYGGPNSGNGNSNGDATPSTGDWWIDSVNGVPKTWTGTVTTQDSILGGTVLLGTGQGASFQTHKDNSGSNMAGFNGQQITIGTITGDSVVLSNAAAGNFPVASTAIQLQVSNDGFQELDHDVELSLEQKANYNYYQNEIPAGESIGSDTLPISLYLTAPDARLSAMGLSGSPFDPFSPNVAEEQIPAAYRYTNDAWPTSVSSSTITVSGSLSPATITFPS